MSGKGSLLSLIAFGCSSKVGSGVGTTLSSAQSYGLFFYTFQQRLRQSREPRVRLPTAPLPSADGELFPSPKSIRARDLAAQGSPAAVQGTIAAGEAPAWPPLPPAAPCGSRLSALARRRRRSRVLSQRRRPAGRPRAPALRHHKHPRQLRTEPGPPGEPKFARTWDRAPQTAPAAPAPRPPSAPQVPRGAARRHLAGPRRSRRCPRCRPRRARCPKRAGGPALPARCLPCAALLGGQRRGLRAALSRPSRRGGPSALSGGAARQRGRGGSRAHPPPPPGPFPFPGRGPRPPPARRWGGRGRREERGRLREDPGHAVWAPGALCGAPRGEQRARPSAAPRWPVRVRAGLGLLPEGSQGTPGSMDASLRPASAVGSCLDHAAFGARSPRCSSFS